MKIKEKKSFLVITSQYLTLKEQFYTQYGSIIHQIVRNNVLYNAIIVKLLYFLTSGENNALNIILMAKKVIFHHLR